MGNFLKTLIASTLGVIIASFIFGFFLLVLMVGLMFGGSPSDHKLGDNTLLEIKLSGNLSDKEADNPFFGFLTGTKTNKLDDILQAIKKAKENDEIKGIYLNVGILSTGIANLEPIRNAILDFKGSGKFVFAYGDMYTQGTYYIASAADQIALNPQSLLDFSGLGSSIMFTRGLHEKLGVKYEVFKVGTFKSAVEPYTQDKMSDANRLQTSSFLNDIWEHLTKGISESRNISVEQLNIYADKFMAFQKADSVLAYGMVDTLIYGTQVEEHLAKLMGVENKKDYKTASIANMKDVKSKRKIDTDNIIAVLIAEGTIMDDTFSSPFAGDNLITPKVYVKELQRLKEDEKVKAVVFRVSSPGGSAFASEQIWNAVAELKKVKPVIVSMGNYAASGGYYISCGADAIVAEPTTLTGSIGIFGLFPDGTELAKKMGVSFDEVKTNEHSNFGGKAFGIPFLVTAASRGLNAKESSMLQTYVENGYDLFLTRCADGRGKTKQQIDSIGQGRVWTGKQAFELGLVDELGSLDDAIALAIKKAGLEEYGIRNYPAKKDFFTDLIEQSMEGISVRTQKFLMGEEEYNNQVIWSNIKNIDIRQAIMLEVVNY